MKNLLILLLFFSPRLFAQTEKKPKTFEVEVDPTAYIMKGYSLHGIYQPGRLRLDAGIYKIQVPESFHGNKGFEVNTHGFGIKAHYLLHGTKGFYTGAGIGYSITEAKNVESGIKKTGNSIGISPEVGYRLFLKKPVEGNFKGFYLEPWLSYGYNFFLKEIKFENVNFKQSHWQFFPAVHIGYRF